MKSQSICLVSRFLQKFTNIIDFLSIVLGFKKVQPYKMYLVYLTSPSTPILH